MTAPPSTETPRHTATIDWAATKGSPEIRDMLASIPELWGKVGPVNLPDAAFDAVARAVTSSLAEAEADRDALAEAYASCSRAIGRRGTEEESLADQITAVVVSHAALTARVAELEAALRQIKAKAEGDRPTVNPKNAFVHWSNLNAVLVIIRGLASDALEAKP